MSCSFVVYVDESGDEGFAWGRGSSEWFVLSAVITRKHEDLQTVKLVDRIRQLLKRPDHKPLHFRDLRHEHRVPFIAEIARSPLWTANLLVHKPSIADPGLFLGGSRLYFEAVHLLLERVSRCCRRAWPEDGTGGDGTAEVLFSNRSGMSYEELKVSLQVFEEQTEDRPVIRCDQVSACSAGRRMGLQIADAVASGFFKAVEPSEYGHTEDRYARMLKPVVYREGETCLGYGLSFWPENGTEAKLEPDERFGWVQEISR